VYRCVRTGRPRRDELARAALERNDRIEVVAADQQSRTFTVRVKNNGRVAHDAR